MSKSLLRFSNVKYNRFHISCQKIASVEYRELHSSSMKTIFFYEIEDSILLVAKSMTFFKYETHSVLYFMKECGTDFQVRNLKIMSRFSYFIQKSVCPYFHRIYRKFPTSCWKNLSPDFHMWIIEFHILCSTICTYNFICETENFICHVGLFGIGFQYMKQKIW